MRGLTSAVKNCQGGVPRHAQVRGPADTDDLLAALGDGSGRALSPSVFASLRVDRVGEP